MATRFIEFGSNGLSRASYYAMSTQPPAVASNGDGIPFIDLTQFDSFIADEACCEYIYVRTLIRRLSLMNGQITEQQQRIYDICGRIIHHYLDSLNRNGSSYRMPTMNGYDAAAAPAAAATPFVETLPPRQPLSAPAVLPTPAPALPQPMPMPAAPAREEPVSAFKPMSAAPRASGASAAAPSLPPAPQPLTTAFVRVTSVSAPEPLPHPQPRRLSPPNMDGMADRAREVREELDRAAAAAAAPAAPPPRKEPTPFSPDVTPLESPALSRTPSPHAVSIQGQFAFERPAAPAPGPAAGPAVASAASAAPAAAQQDVQTVLAAKSQRIAHYLLGKQSGVEQRLQRQRALLAEVGDDDADPTRIQLLSDIAALETISGFIAKLGPGMNQILLHE